MIRFGSMSIVLLLGALYGGQFMLLLWFSPRNRTANRFQGQRMRAMVSPERSS